MEEIHKPVLLSEVIAALQPKKGESYLDLTAGYAGHASRILGVTQNYKDAVLVDRDDFAIKYLTEKYESESVKIVKNDFYSAALQEIECGKKFDMILADFGVSSPQLDRAERGFSFAKDGPLDMRMDQTQDLSASDIVNKWSAREIEKILIDFGEEKPGFARMITRLIIEGRPWQGTKELADAIFERAGHSRHHPATRVFQAIRIAVNDELGEIERTLPLLPKLLNKDGRVAIITFHSLEDRLVKRYFKEQSSFGEESELRIITKSPITAGNEELFINPRSRSAKLRVAERTR
jgi:16S rRNA (cytosine1402-N4)-methyltransferase